MPDGHGCQIERAPANPSTCLLVRFPAQRKTGWEKRFLLRSDAHHDHPSSDHALQRKHLDAARAIGAGVLDCGDLFCAMQGKYDPRSSKSDMPTRYDGKGPYLDWLVDDAHGFLKPYAKNLVMLSPGNHELAIGSRCETDLSTRLADRLRCARQAMQGWVLFRPCINGRPSHGSLRLAYHHGYGGGGPVTKDVIQSHRKNAYTDGADVQWSGHTHDTWLHVDTMWAVSDQGRSMFTKRFQVKTGGYKSEFQKGEGWAVNKGMPPKTNGAAWLIVFFDRSDQTFKAHVELAF